MTSSAEGDIKFCYKRLEPSISRFIKILQIDLDRLHQHQTNIHRFRKSKEFESLDKEQINASRTCQQLKSNIRQLEQTRSRLEDDALEKFDEKTSDIRMQAITAAMEFLDHYGNIDTDLSADLRTLEDSEGSLSPEQEEAAVLQLTKADEADSAQVEKSWNVLQEDLVDLNGLMHEFSGLVTSQQEGIDEIESHVETAADNVESGVKSLALAARLKYAMYPMAGALVGGCVGGPVGLVVGVKLGAAAALTGGLAGYTGGKLFKKKFGEKESQEKVVEAESESSAPEMKVDDTAMKPYSQAFGDT